MSEFEERIRRSLIPIEQIISPLDDRRLILQRPPVRVLEKIPATDRTYKDTWPMWHPHEHPDQGEVGYCGGWAGDLHMESMKYMEKGSSVDLSAGDCYLKARKYDGIPDFLAPEGTNLLGVMKGLNKEGVCHESTRPTRTKSADPDPDPNKPVSEYIAECMDNGVDAYYQVPVTRGMFEAAMSGVVLPNRWNGPMTMTAAVKVYSSIYDVDSSGVVPEPEPGDSVLGGHAICLATREVIDGELYFGSPNSWGADWGDGGWCYYKADSLNSWFLEGWVGHLGPVDPYEEPSDCAIAGTAVGVLNAVAKILGSDTRVKAVRYRSSG